MRTIKLSSSLTIGFGIAVALLLGCSLSLAGLSSAYAASRARQVAVLAILAVIFSWIPFIYAYPLYYAMGEALWIICLAFMAVVWAGIATTRAHFAAPGK
jgi:hypothetical protein